MQNSDISCRALINGKILVSPAKCYLSQGGTLGVMFEKIVELIGTRRRQFTTPSFALYPFTRGTLSNGLYKSLPETILEMSGTDIGYWRETTGPKGEGVDTYRLTTANIKTKYFNDGISLEIDAKTQLGIRENQEIGVIEECDLPALAISILIFIPISKLGEFVMPPDELRFLWLIEESLSKLPKSST